MNKFVETERSKKCGEELERLVELIRNGVIPSSQAEARAEQIKKKYGIVATEWRRAGPIRCTKRENHD